MGKLRRDGQRPSNERESTERTRLIDTGSPRSCLFQRLDRCRTITLLPHRLTSIRIRPTMPTANRAGSTTGVRIRPVTTLISPIVRWVGGWWPHDAEIHLIGSLSTAS